MSLRYLFGIVLTVARRAELSIITTWEAMTLASPSRARSVFHRAIQENNDSGSTLISKYLASL